MSAAADNAGPLCGSHVVIYSDGASRGNPGLAGAGWVIHAQQQPQTFCGCMFLGTRTNNEAEYIAAAMALQAARDMGAQHVILRADSELLVRQLAGAYRVRNVRLLPLYQEVKKLSETFASFAVQHVRRELNACADKEANRAIDER